MKIARNYKKLFNESSTYKGVPNLVSITNEETKGNCLIITGVCMVQNQEVMIKFLRRTDVKEAGFLVREVSKKVGDGEEGPSYETIWRYSMIKIPNNLNRLAAFGSNLIIVVTVKDKSWRDIVKMVFPIEGLLVATPVTADNDEVLYYGAGMNSSVTLEWKKRIARECGVFFDKTPSEETFANTVGNFKRVDEEQRRIDEEQKKKDRQIARAALRETFMARSKRTVFNRSGRPLHGIVLTTEENWQVLNDNVSVIIEENGVPTEFFFVKKERGGHPDKRGRETEIAYSQPKPAETIGAFKVKEFTTVRISSSQAEFLSKKGIPVQSFMEVAVVCKADLPIMRQKFGNGTVFQLVSNKDTNLVCVSEGKVHTLPAV